MTHELRTKRVLLQPVRPEHAAAAFTALSDPQMWTFFPHLRPRDVDDLAARFERWSQGPPPNNPLFTAWENWLGITLDSREVVGLFQTTIMRDDAALVAYSVVPPMQRRGYGREAVRAVVEHLREQHGVVEVFADIHARNEASIALVTALGFKRISGGEEPRYALRSWPSIDNASNAR